MTRIRGGPNLIWHVNLGASVPAATFGADYADIAPEIGILSTPVIDLQRSAIYVTAATLEKGLVVYRLHALDLATRREKLNGPTVITASVSGTGVGGAAGGKIPFDPLGTSNVPACCWPIMPSTWRSDRTATRAPGTDG